MSAAKVAKVFLGLSVGFALVVVVGIARHQLAVETFTVARWTTIPESDHVVFEVCQREEWIVRKHNSMPVSVTTSLTQLSDCDQAQRSSARPDSIISVRCVEAQPYRFECREPVGQWVRNSMENAVGIQEINRLREEYREYIH